MIESIQLNHLPGYARLFVALFVTLMLLVGFWAGWLYTVDKGTIDEDHLPAYLHPDLDSQQVVLSGRAGSSDDQPDLRENLGLAHTHINGQTLLFFAMGLVFLFSSATPDLKNTLFSIFAASIVAHVIGLSGEGFHSIFDDILAISGVAIIVVMAFMAMLIYIDLVRPEKQQHE